MAIRILHVVEALGVGGGVENGIANLIEHTDHDRFEHVLCGVFRLGAQVERYPSDRVRLLCMEQQERKFSVQVGPLARMIRHVKPDIVHSRNWGALEAVIAARWTASCSVIHSEHGVEMNPSAEPRRRSWFRRGAFALADEVFSVSYQLRETLARRTGFPLRKIGVIHNGVDTRRFRPDPLTRRRFREELGIGEKEFCIGCVGRLNKIKDYPTMLRAAETFGASCPSWRLLIVGDGPERSALEEFAGTRPVLAGRVQFLGMTDRVPAFLNAIDAYVLPSLCEGISNSLLEAMAAGVPAVASETGGNPEVIEDGESGLLFPVGDARRLAEQLVLLWSNQTFREGLIRHALRRVNEQFSLSTMVEQYQSMYERLAVKRHARHRGLRSMEHTVPSSAKEERLT
ncbi:MAG TPA: glycosyltransferase [Bryobacteraceae bacterium]|nr:glycosyltransferase [Bryobacteraceae bacterium]